MLISKYLKIYFLKIFIIIIINHKYQKNFIEKYIRNIKIIIFQTLIIKNIKFIDFYLYC